MLNPGFIAGANFKFNQGENKMHTKLPWNIHPEYLNEQPHEFTYLGQKLMALDVVIASGGRIIGKIGMTTGNASYERVNTEQECRDNAALILKAVNVHQTLVDALSNAIDMLEVDYSMLHPNMKPLYDALKLAVEE